MQRSQQLKALARSMGIVAATIALVSGVTFAALQSQQDVLVGNTIETATANLQISTDGTNYGDAHTGFDFSNLVPGGQPTPVAGYSVYLKNAGGTPLALKLAVTSVPINANNVDLSKVNVLLTTIGGGAPLQSFSLQSLLAGAGSGVAIAGSNLSSSTIQQYKLQISMSSDAVNGSGASLGNIDFAFSGLAQSN